MALQFFKCLDCQASNPIFNNKKNCSFCGWKEENSSHDQKQKLGLKKHQEKVVEEMVKYLLPENTPKINFSQTLAKGVAGEYNPELHTIYLPNKTFHLPRDEFTDTVAHESAHPPTYQEEFKNPDSTDFGHGRTWYFKYRKFRSKLFSKYSVWINSSPTLKTTWNKPYKIYPSVWEAEYNLNAADDKFNPYKDD